MFPTPVLYFLGALCGGLGVLMLFWQAGPNGWIGVRMPWTFADREIWDKSWRLAAYLLLVMGLSALISFPAFLAASGLLIVGCIAYPWQVYRKKYGTSRYWKDNGWMAYHPVALCQHCGHLQNLAHDRELPGARCKACGLPCRS
jgi:predicted membrane channel-forming protein YqfA (hemolysin III family)